MPRMLSVTPMIPTCGSLADALKFYTEEMGFSILWTAGNIAPVRRDAISFTLVENSNKEWADNASFSIGVSDLDALYREYQYIGARVGPLEMKSWGKREFHMIVPSGVWFQFFGVES